MVMTNDNHSYVVSIIVAAASLSEAAAAGKKVCICM